MSSPFQEGSTKCTEVIFGKKDIYEITENYKAKGHEILLMMWVKEQSLKKEKLHLNTGDIRGFLYGP